MQNVYPTLTVNFPRLQEDIDRLAEIGASEEDRGLYRMAFTDADMAGRRWLMDRLQEAGCAARMDGAGNVFGKISEESAPPHSDRPCVLMGSHLDTVPAGGRLDGALGVLVALECLRRLKEEAIDTHYPVEIVAFSDEEGRFGGMLGSRALTGALDPEMVYSATDLDGVALPEAMQQQGLDPEAALHCRRPRNTLHSYLELHIEQGPVLDHLGLHCGVVETITGLHRWTGRLLGEADHAGTTPMGMRRDAFQGLVEFAGEIPRVLEEHGGEDSVATIGRADLHPGSANTVPGRVEFSLDVRDTEEKTLRELMDACRRVLSAIARRRGLMFEFDIISEIDPVACDPSIVTAIRDAAQAQATEIKTMPSGAAHDAQIVSAIAPVGMIFVPSLKGRSHSPAEWTHWEDIEIGANVALGALLRIAKGKS